MDEPCSDAVVEGVVAKLRSRSTFGLTKYGVTLAESTQSRIDRLTHIQEELMDAANYIEWELRSLCQSQDSSI